MWAGLAAIPGVTLYGPPPGAPRTPTVAFAVKGRAPEDVARALVPRGVFVSHGDFYASTLVERLGHATDGLVRAGAACYTTEDEVDRLVAGVAALARADRPPSSRIASSLGLTGMVTIAIPADGVGEVTCRLKCQTTRRIATATRPQAIAEGALVKVTRRCTETCSSSSAMS